MEAKFYLTYCVCSERKETGTKIKNLIYTSHIMVGHKLSNPISQVLISLLMQHFYSYPTMKAFLLCFQRLPWLPFTIWDHLISLDASLKKTKCHQIMEGQVWPSSQTQDWGVNNAARFSCTRDNTGKYR